MSNEQQTQQADDPSGPGWRDVEPKERIEQGDVYICSGVGWLESDAIGRLPSEFPNLRYRRRIEPPQPSDSEPETIDSWEMRLAKMTQWNLELEALVAEAERSGQQVQSEMQQLREQVRTLRNDQIAAQQRFAQLIASQEQITKERDAMAAAYHDSCIRGEEVNAELQQLREQVQTLTRKLKDANDTYQICLQSHWKAGRRSAIDKLQTWLRPVLEVVADHPDHSSILAASVMEFLPQIASRLIEE